MTIISILEKVRAPSRFLVRKGLVGARAPALWESLDDPDTFQDQVNQTPDCRENDKCEEDHAECLREVIGSLLCFLAEEAHHAQQQQSWLSCEQEIPEPVHRLSSSRFKVQFSTALLPQRLSVSCDSNNAYILAYLLLNVKDNWVNRKSPYFRAFSGFLSWIKNFSSPQFKTWFAPMFFSGSFAVLSGAASPPAFLAGVVPRRRRGGFALIQVSCTKSKKSLLALFCVLCETELYFFRRKNSEPGSRKFTSDGE